MTLQKKIDKYLPNILAIGGSDSSGGAGIQADILAIKENGGYSATAITAITSQNNEYVTDIFDLPHKIVKKQIRTVIDKMDIKAIKTGMLVNENIVKVIISEIPPNIPMIIDPVFASSSGTELINSGGIIIMKNELLSRATLVTPNIPELEILLEKKFSTEKLIQDKEIIETGKEFLKKFGSKNILIKGGHNNNDGVSDILISNKGDINIFSNPRISGNFRGTGCRLASAISVYLANGLEMDKAVKNANKYISQYIKNGATI